MVFSSNVFLFIFFPALLILYYQPWGNDYFKRRWRNAVLLLFSLLFYGWGEPVFVFIMIASIFLNWLLTLKMSKQEGKNRKTYLCIIIAFDVGLFFVFKYLSFLSRNLALLFQNNEIIVDIALPIGISFFIFQMMSYVFDVYYKKTEAQRNPFYVALYIALFPQLIAGPIVRYRDIEDEIIHRKENFKDIQSGIERFIYGLGKKVLIANYVAQIADNVFDFTSNPSVLTAWLGIIAHTIQMYFDFSGYSDMAIGLGRIFGFHFSENFDYPFISKSVSEFWRRFHISLGAWFRDYVYIPLGGSRVSKPRWRFNLFAIWLFTGIWHGANWTYIVWGLLYYVVMLLEKETGFANKLGPFSRIYPTLVYMFTLVIFRSKSIAAGLKYWGYMFGIGTNGFIDSQFTTSITGTYLILILGIVGATPALSIFFRKLKEKNMAWVETVWLIIVFVLSTISVLSLTYNPFIYFNF